MRLLREQIRFVRSPRAVIGELAGDPRAAYVGFRHVLALAVLWDVAVLLWALGGATVTMPAFLKIPEDRYYFYQLFFMIPMFLVSWILASGIAYLLSKRLGGEGSFDTILGGFGLTAAVSGYLALIPDYVQGVLWSTGWVPFADYQRLTGAGPLAAIVWAYMLGWLAAHLVLYSVTIRHSQRLGIAKSAFAAVVAFFGSFAVWITIVR